MLTFIRAMSPGTPWRGPSSVTRSPAIAARAAGRASPAWPLISGGSGESPALVRRDAARPRRTAAAVARPRSSARSGVRVTRVAVSGGGGLVDLRYQVLDPGAAAARSTTRATPPQLVDERTGVLVNELFMGHSHSGPFKAAETYYLVFDNPVRSSSPAPARHRATRRARLATRARP